MDDPEEYAYITATVDCDELSWTYKLVGAAAEGRQRHDEDVTDWSDEDIIGLTMSMLEVDEAQKDLIRVERV